MNIHQQNIFLIITYIILFIVINWISFCRPGWDKFNEISQIQSAVQLLDEMKCDVFQLVPAEESECLNVDDSVKGDSTDDDCINGGGI
ncbi:hypothetical protein SS50377_23757 [Spironucleus salmonicida]|uniref:Transmembrane protein n=1 Tax=Spironucleus salmonicida TaxID=348837 RepID=V6LRW7_9EUKA|nr:hypothetical protein SS50377_23757 [Spironucleus salmonicida]|eukprot:EST46436.1 Hypothetical protein SS50377_fx076 [Spironucleus salmonicida]